MGYKVVALISLSLAILFMITSEVAARDLAEETSASLDTTTQDEETNGVNDAKYPDGGYGGYPGGGYGGYPGGGRGGYGGYPGGGRGGHGGYGRGRCRYGCCRRDYYGGCRRCCSYAGEAMDAEPEAKPHN